MEPQPSLAGEIQDLANEFDVRCQERHEMGAKKYGPVKFLEIDSLEMAIEEIIDLANYARYTFIRLRLMQEQFNPEPEAEPIGRQGFIPTRRQP